MKLLTSVAPRIFIAAVIATWPQMDLALAEVPCSPSANSVTIGASPVESLQQSLLAAATDWWAASPEQIRRAPCRVPLPNDAEMQAFVNDWARTQGDALRTETIHGIRFENESPRLLELFRTMTQPRSVFGEPNPNPSSLPAFQSKCRIVRCALAELLGTQEATRTLYLYARFGANASPIGVGNTQNYSRAELDDIIRGLSDFPPRLLPRTETVPLNRIENGRGPYGTLANAVIMLFEEWSNHAPEERQATLLHEFAHRLGRNLDTSPEWLRLSGWTVRPQPAGTPTLPGVPGIREWDLADPSRPVSRYGSSNPAEDFAETAVAYRYNPTELARRSPEKYRYMKEVVFQGLEYTSAASCAPESAFVNRVDQQIASSHGATPTSAELIRTSLGPCAAEIFGHLPPSGPLPNPMNASVRACLGSSLINELRTSAFDSSIASTLVYPNEARAALRAAGPTLNQPLPSADLNSRVQDSERAARTALRQALVDAFLTRQDGFRWSAELNPNQAPEPFCERHTEFAYQWVDRLRDSPLRHPTEPHAAFRVRNEISAFAQSVCVKLQATSPTRHPFTREEIESEMRLRIPD